MVGRCQYLYILNSSPHMERKAGPPLQKNMKTTYKKQSRCSLTEIRSFEEWLKTN